MLSKYRGGERWGDGKEQLFRSVKVGKTLLLNGSVSTQPETYVQK